MRFYYLRKGPADREDNSRFPLAKKLGSNADPSMQDRPNKNLGPLPHFKATRGQSLSVGNHNPYHAEDDNKVSSWRKQLDRVIMREKEPKGLWV